ncbi:MAG: ATP-binding cassette domain-containing protein [Clostridium sp.]
MVDQYQVLCKSQDVSIDSLSGGNIQKVVLARELSGDPQVIIADQPTRWCGCRCNGIYPQAPGRSP